MAELSEEKRQARELWALGDYPAVASRRIADVGTLAVETAGVGDGDDVLDVACGSGNATIPAAQAGGTVTGLDLTPQLLEAGRAAARDAGVEIDWVEGDAEQLPFDDASFDRVISVFGCIFAPDQRGTAVEIARVLKPGGRIAVCAWTPEGNIGRMFVTIASQMPPPPVGFQPPILWGSEDHVRGLFEGTGVDLEFARASTEFLADSVAALIEEGERDLPPIVNAKRVLEPGGKWDALRAEIVKLYEAENLPEDGTYRSENEFLVIKGTKSG